LKETAKMEFHLVASEKQTKRVIDSINRIHKIKDKLQVDTGRVEEGASYTSYEIEDLDTDYFKMILKDPEVQKRIPQDSMIMLGRPVPNVNRGTVSRIFALVKKDVAINGMSLKDANVNLGRTANDRHVQLKLDGRGIARLKSVSRKCENDFKSKNIVNRLAIILDDVIYSAPSLYTYIDSSPIISGSFSEQESADLALVLRSGALPAKMEIIQNRTIGATLGADSINRGVKSAIVGLICVLIFMAVYYLLAGLVADFALALNLLILMAVLAFFRATLTLPGIAGIILTIGMAVDANVLIF
jgi:protein-export membrane protein SecD